jgi:clan AA aspartic protease
MGTFSVPIQVGDVLGNRFVEMEALVDTGATYTSIPQDALRRLGIEIRDTYPFELADDRVVEYPVAYASIRLEQREVIALVVFAEEEVTPLLGATTLETARLAVDPVHRELISVPALLK